MRAYNEGGMCLAAYWQAQMKQYQYTIIHRTGKLQGHVNGLSRLPEFIHCISLNPVALQRALLPLFKTNSYCLVSNHWQPYTHLRGTNTEGGLCTTMLSRYILGIAKCQQISENSYLNDHQLARKFVGWYHGCHNDKRYHIKDKTPGITDSHLWHT